MEDLFKSLKTFINRPPIIIDNLAFRLHYRGTFIILLACSIMVTSKQYIGDPIDCISKDDIPSRLLDTYCWIHTTFSLENAWKKNVGHEVPYPGVDKTTENEKRVYHAYYQWVCFVLFFQAAFFYVPRYLWKGYEGGLVMNLTKDLKSPLEDDKAKETKIKLIVKYLRSYENRHNHLFYFYSFAEILNLINVIVQMVIMNRFLGGEFSTYGWDVLNFTEWDWSVRYDPMIKVFPRLTKCTFHRFGASGDVQRHDAMCILPINILNEKIYVLLWFWFYVIAIISAIAILYRVIVFLFVPIRIQRTQAHCSSIDRYSLEPLVSRLSVGDWFLLDMMSKNMDSSCFNLLIQKYYKGDDENEKMNGKQP